MSNRRTVMRLEKSKMALIVAKTGRKWGWMEAEQENTKTRGKLARARHRTKTVGTYVHVCSVAVELE